MIRNRVILGTLFLSVGGLPAAAGGLPAAAGGLSAAAQVITPNLGCIITRSGDAVSLSGEPVTPSDDCATCNSWVDVLDYLLPNYAGWQTARQTVQQTVPVAATTYTRKLLYGTNKFEFIKFNDPHSSETYTWDDSYVYLTAENGIGGGSESRVFPAGTDPLTGGTIQGLVWMPRYVCTGTTPVGHLGDFNLFKPRYVSQVYYQNCNTCPCTFLQSNGSHVAVYSSLVSVFNYPYGGSLGTIPTVLKQDTFDDDSESENYYYGQGYGLLLFQAISQAGQALITDQEVAQVANEPIADQACFHP